MNEISIRNATPDDAPFIGQAVAEAIGHDHCAELAGPNATVDDIRQLFIRLARRPDTQYSFRNAIIAYDPHNGATAGVIVAYPGQLLHQLRTPFLQEAQTLFGLPTSNLQDETDPSEFYIDTLFVDPAYRRHGIGATLIQAARKRAAAHGLPTGLLVDPANTRARQLYEHQGFTPVGTRQFFGIDMHHLQA